MQCWTCFPPRYEEYPSCLLDWVFSWATQCSPPMGWPYNLVLLMLTHLVWYTIVVLREHMLTASSTYTAILTKSRNFHKMTDEEQVFGWIAFAAFNIIYASSLQFIRRRYYEIFYLIHVAMFIVAVVFVGLHKPYKYKYATITIGCIWCLDRLIRTTRLIYYSYNNNATLVPLSGLATKVIFEKPIGCVPGSHAFITIPGIRKMQSHPFTISSSDRIEFVIRAQKGFTLDLHKYALKHPYKQVKAYIDGPYGAVPDFKRMNKVVLFAGGSGGAFLFPIAVDIVRNAHRSAVAHLELVWVIKDERKSNSFFSPPEAGLLTNFHRSLDMVRRRNQGAEKVLNHQS